MKHQSVLFTKDLILLQNSERLTENNVKGVIINGPAQNVVVP
jgi:hypothetical protein